MESLDSWNNFVARRRNSAPLTYLHGFSHLLKKGFRCPMHSHTSIEIVYHPRGRGITHYKNGRATAFDEGSVVIYAPYENHDQVMETEGEDLCVMLAVPTRFRIPQECFSVPRVEDTSIIEDIRLLSRSRVEIDPDEQAIFNLRATSILFSLVRLACARHDDNIDLAEKYVQKAEEYVRHNFASDVTLRTAAKYAGIGCDHLRHVIRAKRDRSFIDYLTKVRIERAKTLLIHSQLPLKQIASSCGFSDEYYFSAVFRRQAGCPPGRYRARRARTSES